MSCALLIADPEPDTGTFLAHHLARDGFEVLRTEDSEAALSLAEEVRPDLVLLGGELDVCRRLREGEPGRSWNRDVPVIVLGAEEADAIDRVRAFDRGADDFVTRPFIYDELLAVISRYSLQAISRFSAWLSGKFDQEREARKARSALTGTKEAKCSGKLESQL